MGLRVIPRLVVTLVTSVIPALVHTADYLSQFPPARSTHGATSSCEEGSVWIAEESGIEVGLIFVMEK